MIREMSEHLLQVTLRRGGREPGETMVGGVGIKFRAGSTLGDCFQ